MVNLLEKSKEEGEKKFPFHYCKFSFIALLPRGWGRGWKPRMRYLLCLGNNVVWQYGALAAPCTGAGLYKRAFLMFLVFHQLSSNSLPSRLASSSPFHPPTQVRSSFKLEKLCRVSQTEGFQPTFHLYYGLLFPSCMSSTIYTLSSEHERPRHPTSQL